MEAKFKAEIKGKKVAEIFELTLDGEKSEKIVGVTSEFTALESLSLKNCGLKSLKGFPKLANLRNLEIGDNEIKDGLEALNVLPELTFLDLADNPIDGVDTLKALGKNTNLKELDLFSVEVSIGKNKRDKIFKYIPSLKFLDGCDKDDKPKEGEEDESDFSDEDDDGEEGEEEEEEGADIPLRDIYDKSLNDTEEDDGDFESGDDEEEDEDVDDELDEEENEEEEDGDDVANLSKESVDEPRTKKQKVSNGDKKAETKE